MNALPATPCPACGGIHDNPLGPVVIGRDIIEDLVRFLDERKWSRILLVSDANTDEAFAHTVASRLERVGTLDRVTFPDRHGLLADSPAVERVRAAIATGQPDAAVVVGSGTLNDITRYSTFLDGIPYVSVPTAASMDGYASAVAAMQFGGMKVSYPAQVPAAIFAELDVMAAAPPAMTSWGLGDLIGKATAHFDWLLSSVVTGEVFCPIVEGRVLRPLALCLDQPEKLLAGNPAGIEALLRGLVESGVAMAMMGSSRPASGAEHHASHFWDLLAYQGRRPHAPHGLQVAYATGLIMELQQDALQHLDIGLTVAIGQEPSGDEQSWLGAQSDSEAINQVRADKRSLFAHHAASWPPESAALSDDRATLQPVVETFPSVRAALDAAHVPASVGFLDLDADMLAATLRYANRIRSRFTVLDFLEAQGRLENSADRLLHEWR